MAVCPGARQSYEQASGPRLPGVAAQGGDFHIGAALEHMMWEGLEQIGQFHAKTPFLMGRRSGDASPGGGGPPKAMHQDVPVAAGRPPYILCYASIGQWAQIQPCLREIVSPPPA